MKKNLFYVLALLLTATGIQSCTKEEITTTPKVKVVTALTYSCSELKLVDGLLISQSKQTYNEKGQMISEDNENYDNFYPCSFNIRYYYEGDNIVAKDVYYQGNDYADSTKTIYVYDKKNRCLSEAVTYSGASLPQTTYHQYDQNGWKIKDSISMNNGALFYIERCYNDEFGNDTLIIDRSNGETRIKYDDKHNRVESVSINNGFVSNESWSYEYDSKRRKSSIEYFYVSEQNKVEIGRGCLVEKYYYQSSDLIDSIIYMQAHDKNAELVKNQKTIFSYEYFEN